MRQTHKKACAFGLIAGLLSAPALAQSNVSVYGIVDTFVAYGEAGGKSFSGLNGLGGLAGDRLGFRGTEDLGNGLKAIYTLEYGFLVDSNTGMDRSRQTWVGLQNDYGSLTAGFQYSPGYLIPGNYQVMLGSAGFAPRSTLSFAGGYSISPGNPARFANSIRYASPNMKGFNVQGIWSFGNQETDTDTMKKTDDDRWAVGGEYAQGPLRLGAIYQQIGVGANMSDTKEFFLGASYDFGVARAMATWSRKNADGSTAADNTLASVGVVVPVTKAGSVHLGYARLNPRGSDNDGESTTLGYIHELSKRTKLYAAYNRLKYQDAAPNPFAVTVAAAGATANTVLMGIYHSF